MQSNIMQRFDNHNVLCDDQHGFRKPMLDTAYLLSSSIAKGKQVDVILYILMLIKRRPSQFSSFIESNTDMNML